MNVTIFEFPAIVAAGPRAVAGSVHTGRNRAYSTGNADRAPQIEPLRHGETTGTPGVGPSHREGNVPAVDRQRQGPSGDHDGGEVNEIRLSGRLAAAPEERVLPSGDALVSFRLVVARPASRRRGPAGGRIPTVDTIDCSAWSAALRRRIGKWAAGDLVTVDGALRRRFWQSPGGARSRYDVEVRQASRLRRAP